MNEQNLFFGEFQYKVADSIRKFGAPDIPWGISHSKVSEIISNIGETRICSDLYVDNDVDIFTDDNNKTGTTSTGTGTGNGYVLISSFSTSTCTVSIDFKKIANLNLTFPIYL